MQEPDGILDQYRQALKGADEKLQLALNQFIKVTKRFVWKFETGEFSEILANIGLSNAVFNSNTAQANPKHFKTTKSVLK
jgi:hypothetical protein